MLPHTGFTLYRQCCPLILASASPRRKQLLAELGFTFQCVPADIDETMLPGESPLHYVLRMAEQKGVATAPDFPESCTISADTVVTLNGIVYGKPADKIQALDMLQALNNATHKVITAVHVQWPQNNAATGFTIETDVTFGNYPRQVLQRYIDSGDPMDKAGAYGIQSLGGFLVKEIRGSYTNVVGLPVARVIEILEHCGCITAQDSEGHPEFRQHQKV